MDTLKTIEAQQARDGIEEFGIGDTLKVHFRIVEGKNERTQIFEGLCISRKNAGLRKTFVVRKISYGVGVERTFPLNSPRVQKVEVVRMGRVRRAKLYYIRDKVGKKAKVKERILDRKAQAKKG